LDHKLCIALKSWTHYTSKWFLPWITVWWHHLNHMVDLLNSRAGTNTTFILRAFYIVSCIEFVVGQDIACCMIWTTRSEAASFMLRLVCLINFNKAKSVF
jgi:hypothetical protein